MRFLSIEKFLILSIITVFSCGAGYVGDLPKLIPSSSGNQQPTDIKDNTVPDASQQQKDFGKNLQSPENRQPNTAKELPPPIMPLAPKDYPAMYEGAVIKQNRYSKYQKDLYPLKEKLEMLKSAMLSNDENKMQLFCAQTNLIDLYVNYVRVKYAQKPERFYESYKTMIVMDKNIVDTANYWKTTMQYMRMIYKSASERKRNQIFFKKKFDNSLKSVNKLLEILNEDLKKI